MANFRTAQKRARKKAEVEAAYKEYQAHKDMHRMYKKAEMIIEYMKRVYWPAQYMSVGDILQKITSKDELEYFYRWCCKSC